jgi:hypothetical protein
MKKHAKVIHMKCAVSRRSYGVTTEYRGNDWVSIWAFPIDDNKPSREQFDTRIAGSLAPVPEFPGCPHCRADGLLQCGCGKMMCYMNGREREMAILCPWCGQRIDNITTVDSLEVGAGGM